MPTQMIIVGVFYISLHQTINQSIKPENHSTIEQTIELFSIEKSIRLPKIKVNEEEKKMYKKKNRIGIREVLIHHLLAS